MNQQDLSPRQFALSNHHTTYHGSVCKKCSTTERYSRSGSCVHCAYIKGTTTERREYQRVYWKKPENTVRKAISQQKYSHSSHGSAKKSQYREANKDRLREKDRVYRQTYTHPDPEQRNNNNKRSRIKRLSTLKGQAHELWRTARNRARRSGLSFNITEQWVFGELRKQNGVCPITGIAYSIMQVETRSNPYTPSIDRIDPHQGYVIGNVRICSWIYNRTKADFTDEVIYSFALSFLKQYVRNMDQRKRGQILT